MNAKTGTLITLLAVMIFATDNLVLKSVPQEVGGVVTIAFASLFAAPMLTVLFWKKTKERVDRKDWRLIALASLFYSGYATLNALSLTHLSADQAAFIFSTSVVFLPLLDLLFVGTKVRPGKLIWIFVILGGVWLASNAGAMTDFVGVAESLVAALLRAAFLIVQNRSVRDIGMPRYLVRMTWGVAIISMILALLLDFEVFIDGSIKPESMVWVVVFAITSLTVATSLYVSSQKSISAFRTMLIFSTQIVFTIIISALMPESSGLHQDITATMLIGMVMIVIGSIFASVSPSEVRDMYAEHRKKREKRRRISASGCPRHTRLRTGNRFSIP